MGRMNNFRMTAIVAALIAVLPGLASADDWKIDAGVTGKETYTDNVTLSSTTRQSDFITEVNPYIAASKKGGRLEADFRYTMQNLFYADQSTRNRTNHQLAGRAKAELYEKELFLDATASISQQITSLLGPIGADTTSATGNLTDVYTLSLSPYWQHRFGSTANLLARYTHSEVTSGASGLASSSTDGVNATLSSGSAFKDVFWSLDFSDQKINYSSRSDVSFSSVSGTLGYALTPKLRVNGTVGYDKNNYAYTSSGKPEASFWNAGASWAPTNRTSLSGTYGERYFGKTYTFALDHRARSTVWHAAYAQDVTTSNTQAALPYGISGAKYAEYLFNLPEWVAAYPDPFERLKQVLQTLLELHVGARTVVLDQANILTNQVFLNKRFDASVTYSTAKTITTLSIFDAVRESLESQSISTIYGLDPLAGSATVKQRGAQVSWLWRMTPRLSANVGLSLSRNSFPEQGRADRITVLNVGLNRTFNHKLNGSVNLRHQQRDSNQAVGDYKENALIGTVNYSF